MGLIEKIKSLLGLGGSDDADGAGDRDAGEDRDVGVTVERDGDRESAAPDADTERAVKTGGSGSQTDAEAGTDAGAGHAAAGTAGDDGGVDVEAGSQASTDAGSQASSDAESHASSETESTADAGEASDAEADTDAEEERRVPSEAVDVIKGIGPTYAGRLSEAGVETVDDLAAADAADLSDRADVPQGRVENWIERAQARSR